mmetsp:Transcript_5692/g.16027  ORF Transcript_5692/g.16027 Transcript_5692/m.16027 type:complete len:1150 (-) Transcript_5692:625-4074(-)
MLKGSKIHFVGRSLSFLLMAFFSFSSIARAFRPQTSRRKIPLHLPLVQPFLRAPSSWGLPSRSFCRTGRLSQHGDIWSSIESPISVAQATENIEYDDDDTNPDKDYNCEADKYEVEYMGGDRPRDNATVSTVQPNQPITPTDDPVDPTLWGHPPDDQSYLPPDEDNQPYLPPEDDEYQTMPPFDPDSLYDSPYDEYSSFIEQTEEIYEQGQSALALDFTKTILEGLNEAQVEAVTQPSGNLTRVLAGPGSGKTRVLTSRIAHLLGQSPRERILAVTFTKKAAGEMQQRVERLLGSLYEGTKQMDTVVADAYKLQDFVEGDGLSSGGEGFNAIVAQQMRRVTLGTFHSVCSRILRFNSDYLAGLPSVVKHSPSEQGVSLDGNFAIADQAEQVRVLREVMKEYGIDDKGDKKLGIRPYSLLSVISSCKEDYAQGKNPFEKISNKPLPLLKQAASKVYDAYRETLISNNSVDFDDLILLAKEMLQEHKDVRERMQRQWMHILVDEFQDTSKSQLDVVKLLTTNSLFIVGDPDQSIYSWRGAHVGMMAEVCDHFPEFNTVYLMENYRSTSNIVKAAQKIISSGTNDSVEASMRQDMKPKREKGPKPRVISCANDEEEARLVIRKIKEGIERDYKNEHQVAIIYRTNAQSRALEGACRELNLPYVVFGSATSFYQRQEVKDCLCFLRWLSNGRDRGAMLRAMVTPTKGIGKQAVARFENHCDEVAEYYQQYLTQHRPRPTPLDVLIAISNPSHLEEGAPRADDTLPPRAMKPLRTFSDQMNKIYLAAKEKSVAEVLGMIIKELDLLTHVDKISKGQMEFEERKQNVRELQILSDRYTSDGPCLGNKTTMIADDELELSPLATFLEDISLVTELADSSKKDSDEHRFVACLMTIHASKGMEFDTVYIVGLEEHNFPTAQAINEGDGSVELEEEKRLCYVAMTRAKTELIMTWRKESKIFAGGGIKTVSRNRSRFIDVLVSSNRRQGAANPNGNGGLPTQKPKQRVGTTSIYGTNNEPRTTGGKATSRRSFQSASRQGESRAVPDGKNRRTRYSRHPSNMKSDQRRQATPKKAIESKPKYTRQLTRGEAVPMTRPTPRKSIQAKPKPKQQGTATIDSTWIYPVGSMVEHTQLGRGLVLPPPPPTDSIDMPVCVKFP